ncbi:hypothetical protein QJS10_CPA03g02058 [Acorus calamus]|uniref:DUF7032 domain-containing protein n=1 Tax=Acorus calamus TaxID=4465 RepID=A0AAV9F862_ACOCL|nr:hypothetical protein QJS10_CPA03g02058 [Acorus calamus]
MDQTYVPEMMITDDVGESTAEEWLSRALQLVPAALERCRSAKGFVGRWRSISSKVEQIPNRLSDLSSHPFFSKNALCREQLQAVCATLSEAIDLAARYGGASDEDASVVVVAPIVGKLQTQSDLDALSARLDLNLRDCGLLVRTGALGEATALRELLARLQIGHEEAKHRALDALSEAVKDDEKSLPAVLGRSNASAIVHLLSASSPCVREKAASLVCSLAESSAPVEELLVAEGALPPLIRLAESGTSLAKEKAVVALERLSASPDTARSIAGHRGSQALIELCRCGESVIQSTAACALRNLSAVPEIRQSLAEDGLIKVMISLLDCGILLGTKEYAAECLRNMTSANDGLRRDVASEGGARALLAYLCGPLPQEPAIGALRNLAGTVPADRLIELGLIPRLVHVLKSGSSGAQLAAASTICRVCNSNETKKLIGEAGVVPLLVRLLEAKANNAREVAAQAVSMLMGLPQNCREVKREEKSVPCLVQLLEPSPNNTAKKYAVACLVGLSSSKKCKKSMVSYGAIGYLKKLVEMEVPGAKKLLEKLERGKLRSFLFSGSRKSKDYLVV